MQESCCHANKARKRWLDVLILSFSLVLSFEMSSVSRSLTPATGKLPVTVVTRPGSATLTRPPPPETSFEGQRKKRLDTAIAFRRKQAPHRFVDDATLAEDSKVGKLPSAGIDEEDSQRGPLSPSLGRSGLASTTEDIADRVSSDIMNKSAFMRPGSAAKKDFEKSMKSSSGEVGLSGANLLSAKWSESGTAAAANASWSSALGFSMNVGGSALSVEPLQMTLKKFLDEKIHTAQKKRDIWRTTQHQHHKAELAESGQAPGSTTKTWEVNETTEREDALDRLHVHAEAMTFLADKLQAGLGPILQQVSNDLFTAHDHFSSLLDVSKSFAKTKQDFEATYTRKMADLRHSILREIKSISNVTNVKETAAENLHRLATDLEGKLLDAKMREDGLEKQVHEQSILIKELSREINIKRLMLKEVQKKTNEVILENRYLRHICAHNGELLKEIEVRKETAALAQEGHETVAKQLRGEIKELQRELAKKESYLTNMKTSMTAQQEEIILAKQCHMESEALLAQMRVERDTYQVHYTPRPQEQSDEAIIWLKAQPEDHLAKVMEERATKDGKRFTSKAGQSLPPKIHTDVLVEALLSQAKDYDKDLRLLKARMQLQNRLLEYLAEDDLESLSAERAFRQPHSKCVIGRGAIQSNAIPPHLRFFGPLVVRCMPLDEVMAMIGYMREERASLRRAETLPASWEEFLHHYFTIRFGAGQPANEAAASFEYSMHLHKSSPQVDLFHQVIQGQAPEELYDNAIAFAEGAFGHFRSLLPPKSAATGDRRRKRMVKKKLMYEALAKYAPWISDGDLVRLKAVIHHEINEKLGEGTAKALKDEVPLEFLMDPPEGDEDTALLLASGSGEGVSQMSPMATALFRLFVNDYDYLTAELLAELVRTWRNLETSMSPKNSKRNLLQRVSSETPSNLTRQASLANISSLHRSTSSAASGTFSPAAGGKGGVATIVALPAAESIVLSDDYVSQAAEVVEVPDMTPQRIQALVNAAKEVGLSKSTCRDEEKGTAGHSPRTPGIGRGSAIRLDMSSEGLAPDTPQNPVSLEGVVEALNKVYIGRVVDRSKVPSNAPAGKRRQTAVDSSAAVGSSSGVLDSSKLAEASKKSIGQMRGKRPPPVTK